MAKPSLRSSDSEDPWSNLTTHAEEYYVRDLHLDISCMDVIANKFCKNHAIQEQRNKLCPDTVTKLLGKVSVEPDQFKLHRRGQNCQVLRNFVQESEHTLAMIPAAAIGRDFFKTLAINIKARHASHSTLPTNSYALDMREKHD